MTTVYMDASVMLRWVLAQPGYIAVDRFTFAGIASSLARTECWRTLDRQYLEDRMTAERREAHEAMLEHFLEGVKEIDLSRAVLRRAASRLPAPLATLDAIHLATALLWRELHGGQVEFATHDQALARAARLHGFPVIGV